MAEGEPSYLGIPIRVVADGMREYAGQYAPFIIGGGEYPKRLVLPKQALVEAGISFDNEESIDLDPSILEVLVYKSIDPTQN